jgi:cellulose synthase/poly-beta-1,6-N-acetylglucosamine synthase-like glycosyltransferase
MQIIVLVILFLYLLLILKYWIGWIKNKATGVSDFLPKVSVIIALRNEQKQVIHLLSELKKQVYPIDKLEFRIIRKVSN